MTQALVLIWHDKDVVRGGTVAGAASAGTRCKSAGVPSICTLAVRQTASSSWQYLTASWRGKWCWMAAFPRGNILAFSEPNHTEYSRTGTYCLTSEDQCFYSAAGTPTLFSASRIRNVRVVKKRKSRQLPAVAVWCNGNSRQPARSRSSLPAKAAKGLVPLAVCRAGLFMPAGN